MLARWLSMDPIESDPNLYRYVGNRPLSEPTRVVSSPMILSHHTIRECRVRSNNNTLGDKSPKTQAVHFDQVVVTESSCTAKKKVYPQWKEENTCPNPELAAWVNWPGTRTCTETFRWTITDKTVATEECDGLTWRVITVNDDNGGRVFRQSLGKSCGDCIPADESCFSGTC